MNEVLLALTRTGRTLRTPKVWAYLVIPAAVSLVIFIGLSVTAHAWIVQQLLAYPPMTLLAHWGQHWLAHVFAYLGGWMAVFAAAYLCASLAAAIVIMPLLLKHLAATDYRDVTPMGSDSFIAATANSVFASAGFTAGWLLTMPLWLIPGMSLILPLLLMGWLNRRTFAYDALSMHATDAEWQCIRREHKGPLLMLGITMALLACLPFIGPLVPTAAALSFIHYGLEALRRHRGDAPVTIEGERL